MTHHTMTDRDHDLLFGDDALERGDAVVHFEHGLAKYDGQEKYDLGDTTQTLTTLIYREGGKLTLPAEEGRDFWRYGAPAEDLSLDRLKAGDWIRHRDAMIVELRQSAEHMLEEDKRRRSAKAQSLTPDAERFAAFVQAFAHEPTVDQDHTFAVVADDLAATEPMNRLLVGDVGFGKTEVAMRAAAAAVLSGHQVVIAAPTTVLARQHFDTFRTRFAPLGVDVIELSRLTPDADRAAATDRIAAGKVCIVVGTQTLLGVDLRFGHLALVVIDEEQKFGQEQKAALRDLAPGAHILSMTATPIPRSLAAAEVGLVDVSVLATPPKARKPVETHVAECDEAHLLRAIATEIARGGQCYVVSPRIAGVEELDTKLRQAGVDFTYAVAHGRMADDDMSAAMLGFMNKDVDVLLCTSIIENGLDNARANTMVVWNADMFGLSQLHQLRGRIGRSKRPAHMLLLTDVDRAGDSEAAHRLRAFVQMSEVGAGFRIARRDRDIRGFGALDGTEQSGQLSRLGIGLYRHILKMHIAEKQ
ncbi:DEAD/DEAH box helicase [Loktanella sp. SALINAS62]|uniref:DEAD/DEAH box helicase n=1 Tax=Loktanella sp. SALINAS62 TaxID=2706124 RepID=UPI001B8B6A54|nr:DEAD/DEAH box helicase [Loktanella sp. SALINAS62]MBS1301153.1 DEAD/DEAH box helicase [Loktanella sp. SALINAS62]